MDFRGGGCRRRRAVVAIVVTVSHHYHHWAPGRRRWGPVSSTLRLIVVIDDAVRCPLATGLRGCGRWECVGMLLGSEHGHSGTKIKAKKNLL